MNKIFHFNADITTSIGNVEDKDFYVEGYAATDDLDRQGEIIALDALRKAAEELKTVNTTVFYGHVYDLKDAVGRIVDAYVDDTGLRVKVYISSLAKELRVKISEGIITKFSIGGRILDKVVFPRHEAIERQLMTEEDPYDEITLIKKIELFEVSLVGVPANSKAQVVGTLMKALKVALKGGETVKEKKDIEQLDEKEEVEKEEKKDLEIDEKSKEDATQKEEIKTESSDTELSDKETSKEEVSEEDVKDLLEEEEKTSETKYPYYYYYGKDVKEAIDKLGEAVAKIEAKLDKVIEMLKEKMKSETDSSKTESEKKSIIKNNEEVKESKSVDVDEEFYKFLTQK